MGSVDPSDPAAVGAAAARWLSDRLGLDAGLAETPSRVGDGYDTLVHRVRFAGDGLPDPWGRPLVLRVHPSAERDGLARHEAAIQGFCAERGYPCPRVLATAAPGEMLDLPVQVMERAPGVTMLAVISRRPWRLPGLVARLGQLHARLHALPVDGFPVPAAGGRDQAGRRLHLVREVVRGPGPPVEGLAAALGRVEALVPRLEGGPQVVCHGDFHPLNVLVDGDRMQVLDWTNASLGDPHGDVATLLTLLRAAPAGVPGAVGKAVTRVTAPRMARGYLRAYERAAASAGAAGEGTLDTARLLLWEPVHLVHNWARAAVVARDTEPGRRQIDPAAVAWCRRRFAEVTARLPSG